MLRQTETPTILEQKPTAVPDVKADKPNEAKPNILLEVKSQNPQSLSTPQETHIKDFVTKAHERFLEAQQCYKEKNYNYAVCHYTDTITNAFLAIETKQKNLKNMYNLIDKSIRFLADFAADKPIVYQSCQDDAKIKFALTYEILSKEAKFSEHLPVVSDIEYNEKIALLCNVLTDRKELLISLIKKEENADLEELYLRGMNLKLKELYDTHTEDKSLTENKSNTLLQKTSTRQPVNKLTIGNNSIFKSPLKTGAAFIIPGIFVTSVAYAGLYVAFLGGLSFFTAGAVGSLAYNNMSDCCRKKPKPS